VRSANPWLVAGGCMSAAASLLHLACIAGGPDWYRFFGAGEPIARAAERGSGMPAALTGAIALVLAIWAAYAFAGARLIPRLPLMRTVLAAITMIYLARGAFVFAPGAFGRPDLSPGFMLWSSLVVLVIGLVHAAGTARGWTDLGIEGASQ
jgi:hypothetical protein